MVLHTPMLMGLMPSTGSWARATVAPPLKLVCMYTYHRHHHHSIPPVVKVLGVKNKVESKLVKWLKIRVINSQKSLIKENSVESMSRILSMPKVKVRETKLLYYY